MYFARCDGYWMTSKAPASIHGPKEETKSAVSEVGRGAGGTAAGKANPGDVGAVDTAEHEDTEFERP